VDALWQWDQNVFRAIHLDGHRPWLDPFFWVISTTGLGYVHGVAILIYCWARKQMFLFMPLTIAWALPGILNGPFKEWLPRERPSNYIWAREQERFYGDSFASGHSATSFGLGLYIAFLMWDGPYRRWAWVPVLWSMLVGYSRIYRGVHWATDVIAAFFIGLLVAVWLDQSWRFKEGEESLPRTDPSGETSRTGAP
jgi:undecaprenyl-diphosphatase